MCAGYSASFVKLGWLKHRTGFATADPKLLQGLDLDRARHEIPLVDTQTGVTLYGLDAFFFVIKNRFPALRTLLDSGWVRRPVGLLYQIITYNRRVIAGSRPPETGFDCGPDVNFFYRRLYVVLAVSAVLLLGRPLWLQADGGLQVLAALHGAVGLGMLRGTALQRLNYAGHWATVLLLVTLLAALLPVSPVVTAGLWLISLRCWWKRLGSKNN